MSRLNYEEIAKLCHAVNRAYCASLGDYSQNHWGDAQEWQKESAIKGVEFHMMNANAAPEGSHNSWLIEKAANGWKYGPVKDIEKKEHPCMVEYEQLPVAQQAKDYIFKAICDFFR